MKLALVGVGAAGARIVNRVLAAESSNNHDFTQGNVLVIDTESFDGDDVRFVRESRRLLIGDTYRGVEGDGTGGDAELGVEVAGEELPEIRRAFDDLEFLEVDGVLVVAGLAGGTGGGVGPVVVRELKAICDKPVYGLGVLPSSSSGQQAALNATRALQSVVRDADNLVAFDNDAWTDDGDDPDYDRLNRAVARRVVGLFGAGEYKHAVAETRLDSSDVIRTLSTGGVSSIGFASFSASAPSGGLLGWLRGLSWFPGNGASDGATDAARIKRLVRRAARSALTLPCGVASTERALVVLSGPPRDLSRKGFESGRYWLEDHADTVEVVAGDAPRPGASEVSAAVLFSNVTEVPRIDEMQDQAVHANLQKIF